MEGVLNKLAVRYHSAQSVDRKGNVGVDVNGRVSYIFLAGR